MQLKNADHFRKASLLPAIEKGFIERTISDKMRSKNQLYLSEVQGDDCAVDEGVRLMRIK